MINIWDFQVRKSRCLVLDFEDDKCSHPEMMDTLIKRWKKLMKLNLKMVGKNAYEEEKSLWSHRVVRMTVKNKRDKNSRSYSLLRLIIILYEAAYNLSSIDDIEKAVKRNLKDDKHFARMVRLIQAALITKCHGQPRVRFGENQGDVDEHKDDKEDDEHSSEKADKNEERKNDIAGGDLDPEGQDQDDDESDDVDEFDYTAEGEVYRANKFKPEKIKHFMGRP